MLEQMRMVIKKRPWLRQRLLPLALEWRDLRFAYAKIKARPAKDEPALNGQVHRRAAFEAIIMATNPEEIVETEEEELVIAQAPSRDGDAASAPRP